MARYSGEDARYSDGADYAITRPVLTSAEISEISSGLAANPVAQVTPDQIAADQNNFPIPPLSSLIRFDSDAARTITGFSGARPGMFMIAYFGANSIVLPNENAGSDAENRMLTHSGASITLTTNQLAIMQYDFTSARWRIGELA